MNKTLYLPLLFGFAATAVAAAENRAAAPDAKTAAAAPRAWSPYQPVKDPAAPAIRQKAWPRTPIDAFVLAQIEAKGIKPSPEADRATFIRRATCCARI